MKRFILLMLLVGCGAQEQAKTLEQATPEVQTQKKVLVQTNETISFAVSKQAELPACDASIEHQLAYVKETAFFYTCQNESWEPINVVGARGDTGAAGQNGTNGLNGQNGIDGQDGADGASYMPMLLSSLGAEIGHVAGIDTTSRYLVVKDDGMRLQVYRTDGTISAGYYYYSGANCNGTRYSVRTNGDWSNTNLEAFTGKIFKQVGNYATVSYLSRSTGSGCTTTSGTITRAYLTQEVTLNGYPWGETELQ